MISRFVAEGVPAFGRAEFADVFFVAMGALDSRWDRFEAELRGETRVPQAGRAIAARFAAEPERGAVCLLRLSALVSAMQDPRANAWMTPLGATGLVIAEALIEAAAVTTIKPGTLAKFDLDEFFRLVAEFNAVAPKP